MADTLLLRALKGKAKKLNFSNKKLDSVPPIIGKIVSLTNVELKNNRIRDLPAEFGSLVQLAILNLGNNELEDLPEALAYLLSLQRLHVFQNRLRTLNPRVLIGLQNLTLLNLNHNDLVTLPEEIGRLCSLQYLSLDHNHLVHLPSTLCACVELTELHVAYNNLQGLPLEIGYLTGLTKLHLQRNRIKELPEGLGKLLKLTYLDVAGNELRIFPTELGKLPIRELYCEENPLLSFAPVHSVQEEEVLALKEIAARFVMNELKDRFSYMRKAIRHYPAIREMLAQASRCAMCDEAFLNTWLECVHFIDVRKDLKTKNYVGTIPVRALLCSYKCFNRKDHHFYGVAFP
ncbi:PREDICTED: leucine-rich repeat-containing protein 69-like [Branchiostoma belcheri]|uniref:Leucine-rich repeat-containing protein 69-like n=1 Tax=Branchiostoma belcheri TaxID=7741 RepID=A0A6P4Z601_BRABE|nr:PREDICTED: leucine-rich repeat-containing protein 69-like [Branchiostoma belcheri]KAI8481676.1 Leucine rich repeat [Branchiostoma belcheri]